jgi:hypothetical protein
VFILPVGLIPDSPVLWNRCHEFRPYQEYVNSHVEIHRRFKTKRPQVKIGLYTVFILYLKDTAIINNTKVIQIPHIN